MDCKECGNVITGSGKVFCSLSCSSSFNGRNRDRIDRSRHCVGCSKEFYFTEQTQRFCSRSCAAAFNNKSRKRISQCQNCNSVVDGTKDYCGQECRSSHRISRWLSNELDACKTYALATWARRYVLERAGYRCEAVDSRTGLRCEESRIHPTTGKTVLQVDHIDGKWQNCSAENLRAICPTCHALTDTYGSLNKGNGRTWKQGYKQFESINKKE